MIGWLSLLFIGAANISHTADRRFSGRLTKYTLLRDCSIENKLDCDSAWNTNELGHCYLALALGF